MSAAPELSDQQAGEHPIVVPLRRRDARALPMAGGRAANLGELMSDLADAAALSLSGMTRIINRLQDLGLVQREQCAEDGRGRRAVRTVLTDAGFERLREAWPAHLAGVRRHVTDADLPRRRPPEPRRHRAAGGDSADLCGHGSGSWTHMPLPASLRRDARHVEPRGAGIEWPCRNSACRGAVGLAPADLPCRASARRTTALPASQRTSSVRAGPSAQPNCARVIGVVSSSRLKTSI